MKAFFTVTEDSLSRRMGIFKLRFTLYIMCKFINGKGEEKNCQQSFTIFSIDAYIFIHLFMMLLVMQVCLFVCFFKLLSYPCQQEPQYCRHGKS